MRLKILALIIFAALLMRCSVGGSFGDFAGGGVIGNPTSSTFTFTDTIHCTVATKITGPLDSGGVQITPGQPTGPTIARVNQQQRYGYLNTPGMKNFRFATQSENQVSSWTQDSVIVWTWTKAGICSVQVRLANGPDTSNWSQPLMVNITK